jgi:hypothetical protein
MALFFYAQMFWLELLAHCMYLLYILSFKTSSEPVISYFNKGKSFIGGLPFCNFVRNTIYVISKN